MRFIQIGDTIINVYHIVKVECEIVGSEGYEYEYYEVYIIDSLGHKHQYHPTNPRDDVKSIMDEVMNFIKGGTYNLSTSNDNFQ